MELFVSDEMEHDRRSVLADWVGKPVQILGRLTCLKRTEAQTIVALAHSIEVTLPTRATHLIGHNWIQHAELLKVVERDCWFTCECTVHRYLKDGLECWGLTYPRKVKAIPDTIAFRHPEL